MRLSYFFILSTLLFFAHSVSADCVISSTLRLGSKGAEVKCLQRNIGAAVDGKFGPKTKAAVMAWQASNRLVPDGVVGSISLSVFNRGPLALVYPTPDITMAPSSLEINPNISNMNKFIENVVEVNRKNGATNKELEMMADVLRKEITNSKVDYRKEFENMLIQEASNVSFNPQPAPSIFNKIFGNFFSILGLSPRVAHAQTGIPFGGILTYAFFCGYNASWMIEVVLPDATPPQFWVLTYYPGTQGFASYNIPFTTLLLGLYSPPGVCVIPASFVPITIPTQGTITPVVGSSTF